MIRLHLAHQQVHAALPLPARDGDLLRRAPRGQRARIRCGYPRHKHARAAHRRVHLRLRRVVHELGPVGLLRVLRARELEAPPLENQPELVNRRVDDLPVHKREHHVQAVLHQPVVARALGYRRVLVLLPLENLQTRGDHLELLPVVGGQVLAESVGERVDSLRAGVIRRARHRVLIQRELGEVDAVGVPDAVNHLLVGDGEDGVEAAELGAAALPVPGAAPAHLGQEQLRLGLQRGAAIRCDSLALGPQLVGVDQGELNLDRIIHDVEVRLDRDRALQFLGPRVERRGHLGHLLEDCNEEPAGVVLVG
mmetsp:Transcript_9119/g.37262  ORF Transcript_9119/g.37262 Transcript_9119/m.37262 type:complete len:309 (+) Transcript_9119:112-1038(+)